MFEELGRNLDNTFIKLAEMVKQLCDTFLSLACVAEKYRNELEEKLRKEELKNVTKRFHQIPKNRRECYYQKLNYNPHGYINRRSNLYRRSGR